MNEFSTQNLNQSQNSPTQPISVNSSGNNSINSNSIMRDSVSSFQSYILSTSNVTPSSPTERVNRPNRKFRHIAQISHMFANYNQNKIQHVN